MACRVYLECLDCLGEWDLLERLDHQDRQVSQELVAAQDIQGTLALPDLQDSQAWVQRLVRREGPDLMVSQGNQEEQARRVPLANMDVMDHAALQEGLVVLLLV